MLTDEFEENQVREKRHGRKEERKKRAAVSRGQTKVVESRKAKSIYGSNNGK